MDIPTNLELKHKMNRIYDLFPDLFLQIYGEVAETVRIFGSQVCLVHPVMLDKVNLAILRRNMNGIDFIVNEDGTVSPLDLE